MNITVEIIVALLLSMAVSYALVFPVMKLAVKWKMMDYPELRKIHKEITPRMGGLAIFGGAAAGMLFIRPDMPYIGPIIIGAFIIVLTGLLDDRYQIRPIFKLGGQVAAAAVLIFSGLKVDVLSIPFIGMVSLSDPISIIFTFLWIIGITNAINLIDGLDGLAAGVSTISLISIAVMALAIEPQISIVYLCIVLIGSNIGFLFHNFNPASIYMGDTGSLFLGYSMAVISMVGLFKNVTLFSFVIPIIVLAVPVFDTLFSILRRMINKQKIMMPDNKHIHYQILAAGFSHRATVLIIYAFSALFGLLALLFSLTSFGISLIITFVLLFLLHLFAEMTGVVYRGKRPIIGLFSKTEREKNKDKEKA
ncbi:undecaprenyl/decaprenyl-phosphate alpha-N-acetylglucosaminyl 1-phosphate transferase [Halobacillus kuroshimensis]|uniref:Undecaprenyl/decaprenyl-phosphate alpha-N-acetylglucosaminyl 1-phosphate transferase n=1 Tax=Halobacillus kuroshimensis TaxID=302481 RepID=A0ABS3DUV4_9BACI|nr:MULTISPECIES: MraY family glycosyltransferase [Halobacillus]MBN8235115.1 undecaprenyl/decaprenyl-phosphate alpha-N-acetylglucosaminyl 1-phosphate transferase [Halobacillus kuroshimensis]